jgi:hypothetical protein
MKDRENTHNIGHFSKTHNEVPRMEEYESSSDEEEAPPEKSAFESILPAVAIGGAGAVIGYRNRKGISKVKKGIKAGVRAVGRGIKTGAVKVGRMIRGRFK